LLVHAGDVAELAEAMLQLLANPELSRQMGAAGRRRAEAEFSRERIWHELEREYVRELERRGLPLPEFPAMHAATAGVKGG
jgi:glycosyltransferase involved in cell wall biosynthesis